MAAILGLLSWLGDTAADTTAVSKPEDWERRLEMLRSMPYLAYTEEAVPETASGVVFYNSERTSRGYNFYCARATGEIFLLDMDGQEVHRWNYSPQVHTASNHAIMLPDGDVIAIREFQELLRINWDSALIWRKKLVAHHDVAVDCDGALYVIARELKGYRGKKVWFDYLVHMTGDGEELGRWSTYDHLPELRAALDTRSFLDTVLDSVTARSDRARRTSSRKKDRPILGARWLDYFHMNTVAVLPTTALGKHDVRFKAGNLLVCFRNVNQIAVLEKETDKVLWSWGEGQLQQPHHPTMLPNGHILIFDNGVQRGYSRVVELDPIGERIIWEYRADPPGDFYSRGRGSAQRLPNGNTLICESDQGRAFEVTAEGEIVWAWLNPAVQGKRRGTLYRMLRWPPEAVEKLLRR